MLVDFTILKMGDVLVEITGKEEIMMPHKLIGLVYFIYDFNLNYLSYMHHSLVEEMTLFYMDLDKEIPIYRL